MHAIFEPPNPDLCPPHLLDGLVRYIVDGTPTGGFLRAVLANDLIESFNTADFCSMQNMHHIVSWIYNRAPSGCHGSYAAVSAWLSLGEQERLERIGGRFPEQAAELRARLASSNNLPPKDLSV